MAGEFASAVQEAPKRKKVKKRVATFTGVAAVAEIDDIEDLDTAAVKQYLENEALVKKDQKDWQWRPLDERIECQKSLYLCGKQTKFRRLCFNLQKHKQKERGYSQRRCERVHPGNDKHLASF